MANQNGTSNGDKLHAAWRAWLAPGIVIALVSSILSITGSYTVNNYRLSQLENTANQTNDRIDKIWQRIDQMSQSGIDLARTQEQMRALSSQISEMKSEFREQSGRNDARYDNLSTRLARQGF